MWLAPQLPRKLEAALRDLDEASPKVRASAVADLARYADSPARADVLDALARMLVDTDPQVRAAAATALGEAKAKGHVEKLLAAADDRDELVRQMALEALGAVGDDRAAERVVAALDDRRPEMRFQAVLAVRNVAPDRALDALAHAAADEDAKIRYVALRAAEEHLQGNGGFEARRSVDLPPTLRRAAVACLGDASPEVRVAAALLLASAGDHAADDVLLAVVDDRTETREPEDEAAAVEAVGVLGLGKAIPALERRAWGTSRIFRDRFSYHARIALARLGVDRARQEIVSGLASWSREARTAAVIASGRALLAEARPKLESLRARGSVDPELVDEALAAIAGR